jgi:excisionase family DNA binding protein
MIEIKQDNHNTMLLNVAELAAALNIKITHVYKLSETGAIPHYKFGRCLRFNLQDVLAETERQSKLARGTTRTKGYD